MHPQASSGFHPFQPFPRVEHPCPYPPSPLFHLILQQPPKPLTLHLCEEELSAPRSWSSVRGVM